MAEAALDLVEKEQGIDLDAMEAYSLLAQGKRNLLCGEIPNAVNQLQEACRMLAGKFGDTADECGEVYYTYGCALLELSRMESGVLGNALDGVEEESSEDKSPATEEKGDDRIEKDEITDEQKEKISEEVIDAMLETDEELKARTEKEKKSEEKDDGSDKKEEGKEDMETDETKSSDADKEGETSQDEDKKSQETAEGEKAEGEEGTEEEGTEEEGTEEEGTEDEEGEKEGDTEDESKEGGSEKKEEDDVSNLQLAWEMLELAKIIYKRNITKEIKLKLADTFLKLGEVGLETENYETAISDFKECLKLQQELLDSEDRALAETYYQLGLAYASNAQYDDAISSYRSAASSIEGKIGKLKKVVEEGEKEGKGKETANADDPLVKAQKELKDLQDIIPDIMAKIEDVLDEKRSADTVKKMVKDNVAADLTQEKSTTGFTDNKDKGDAAPMDISHLVRKKRKPEEDVEDLAKKAKTENGDCTETNGTAATNGTTNGTANGVEMNGTAENQAPEVTAS